MTKVVDAAFPYFANLSIGETSLTCNYIGLGYGTIAEANGDNALSTPYPSGGFEPQACSIVPSSTGFTVTGTLLNSSGSARKVTEAGLFLSDGNTLIVRSLLTGLKNYGIVPDGERITIVFTVTITESTLVWVHTSVPTIQANYSITATCTGTINPNSFQAAGTNTILVDAAYPAIANILSGISASYLDKIGAGYGDAEEDTTLTALDSPYSDGGFEPTDCTFEYLNTTAYPFCLHAYVTLTNTSSDERQVTEVGLFQADGTLFARHLFTWDEIENFGYVPAGKSITINFYILFRCSYNGLLYNGVNGFLADFTIACSAVCNGEIDITTFDNSYPVQFNGNEIPNCGIKTISGKSGERIWSVISTTEDTDKIDILNRYAFPINAGNSISGYSYVLSPYRPGVLVIKEGDTYVPYENCYIEGPIQQDILGNNRVFSFNIYQSKYDWYDALATTSIANLSGADVLLETIAKIIAGIVTGAVTAVGFLMGTEQGPSADATPVVTGSASGAYLTLSVAISVTSAETQTITAGYVYSTDLATLEATASGTLSFSLASSIDASARLRFNTG